MIKHYCDRCGVEGDMSNRRVTLLRPDPSRNLHAPMCYENWEPELCEGCVDAYSKACAVFMAGEPQ